MRTSRQKQGWKVSLKIFTQGAETKLACSNWLLSQIIEGFL